MTAPCPSSSRIVRTFAGRGVVELGAPNGTRLLDGEPVTAIIDPVELS